MKKILFPLFVLFIYVDVCFSQITINGGDISGLWERSKSPYQIYGDIMIPDGKTLTIEKGVKVEFKGHHKFIVHGRLLAVGDITDSIYFTTADNTTKWAGIRFENISESNDSSKMSHCVVEKSYAYSGKLPQSTTYDDYGGGIFINASKIIISNSVIRNNKAYSAGGIYCSQNVILKNLKITNNYAEERGGLVVANGSSQIIGCVISNNLAEKTGGIYISFCSPLFMNNTISNNVSKDSSSAAILISGSPIFINNIFYYNYPKLIMVNDSPNPQFKNCCIEGGLKSIWDAHPTIKGEFNGVFSNNIECPPEFVDEKQGNYQLNISPCINSGRNIEISDYNSDVNDNPRIFNDIKACIDIGAYEYQSSCPNRRPYLRKVEDQQYLSSQKSKLFIYYSDADSNDQHSFNVRSSNQNVSAKILEVNDTTVIIEVLPKSMWKGDCYVNITISDNTNSFNSSYSDSVKIFISDRFKGEITSDVIFQDTVKVIGDITIFENGSLLIKKGAYIEFQDHYIIRVFGRLNILGTEQEKVTIKAVDSILSMPQRGWKGIEFIDINRSDTMFLKYCEVKNTGNNKEGHYYNGTISIINCKNIYFDNCSFKSNYYAGNDRNSGIYVEKSHNVKIENCYFSEGMSALTPATYLNTIDSEIIVDSCSFFNTSNVILYNSRCIHSNRSSLVIKNSNFFKNSCNFLISSFSGSLTVENCLIKDNKSKGIEILTEDALIRNNKIINNEIAIRTMSRAIIVNNLIAYNNYRCECSNFFGVAVDLERGGETLIANNTIVNNFQDSFGSAVYASYCNPTVVNNIFWNNNREGVEGYSGAGLGYPDPIVKNNVIKGYNENLNENFSFDPQFSLIDSLDYTLLNSSPYINKGLSDTSGLFLPYNDLLGNRRVDLTYKRIDLGAFEYAGNDVPNVTNFINLQSLDKINFFPNPAHSVLYLSKELNDLKYSIINLSGQTVQSGTINDNSINISNLNSNTYILKIGDSQHFRKLFMKL
jgi:hypothetical protein